MTTRTFNLGMRQILQSDAIFVAAITALLGRAPTLIKANVPIESIPASALPVVVIEQGDGESHPIGDSDHELTIGNYTQGFRQDLHVALIWMQQDTDIAADQRAALPEIFVQLMRNNPQPGGVTNAWVQGWVPDRSGNHPTQVWGATIRAEYEM